MDTTKYNKEIDLIRVICKVIKEDKALMKRICEAGFERVFIGAEIIDSEKSDIEGILLQPVTIKAHKDIYHKFRWS